MNTPAAHAANPTPHGKHPRHQQVDADFLKAVILNEVNGDIDGLRHNPVVAVSAILSARNICNTVAGPLAPLGKAIAGRLKVFVSGKQPKKISKREARL